ncbi:MAG: radical SAM protein [Candidatus Margulisbacteria bacterium]|nr:radical SAM protein [Candidatus Margulisiibacteriota bacterium]
MPKICNYYVTSQCNDTCEFCPIWQDEEYKKIEEKPFDLITLKRHGVSILNITGGEPLLRDDLPQILKQAKELGFKTQLTTNGLLYSEKPRWIDGLVDRLFFSLDYPMAEAHDRSRGIECFHDVIKAIQLAKANGEKPVIKFTLTRDSVLFLPEMLDLAEKLNVFVYLNPVYDFYNTQGFEQATISHIKYYGRDKRVLLNLAALEFLKDNGNRTNLPRCRAKQTTITVLPDGKIVSPCFFNQAGVQGREDICSSCMRWPYMLPSFDAKLDKYYLLNKWSEFLNKRKGMKL